MKLPLTLAIGKKSLERISGEIPIDGNISPSGRDAVLNHLVTLDVGDKDVMSAVKRKSNDELISLVLMTTGGLAKKLAVESKRLGISVNTYAAALFAAAEGKGGDIASAGGVAEHPMNKRLAASKRKAREAQLMFYQTLMQALTHGKVGLNEAATGIGKTATMLCAAADVIASNGGRLVLAVPTIALIGDFAREHSKLDGMPALRTVLGRNEFVNAGMLRAFVAEWDGEDSIKRCVLEWIDAGGPPDDRSGLQAEWLVGSLRRICPEFPVEVTALQAGADEDDPGQIAYLRQFQVLEEDPEEEIIVCTHAMLANDLRQRMLAAYRRDEVKETRAKQGEVLRQAAELKKDTGSARALSELIDQATADLAGSLVEHSVHAGKLPPHRYLLVDEAHLLEQSFSSALSDYVSVFQLRENIRSLAAESVFTKAAYSDLVGQINTLVSYSGKWSGEDLNASLFREVSDLLASMHKTIERGLKKLPKDAPRAIVFKHRIVKHDAWLLHVASIAKQGVMSFVRYSPVRQHPQVHVGRSSLNDYFSLLWASVDAAACVSATLYLPRGDGTPSGGYIKNLLNIPAGRLAEYPPISPAWVRDTVKEIRTPKLKEAPDGRVLLRPPSRADRLSEEEKSAAEDIWLDDVAAEIGKIYRSADGGVLVLMTSYATAKSLYERLPPNVARHAVVAEISKTLAAQRHEFHERSHLGERMVWIAVGQAWQSLNIGGHEPMVEAGGKMIAASKDNVLTDLVIPRLPFGTNRSITHAMRREKHGNGHVELIETLFKLRQGIGRLVRREGLPKNRRIHILDARLVDGTLRTMADSVMAVLGVKGR